MKEIKIIQDDEGQITIESTDAEGNPITTSASSVEDAVEQVKTEMGSGEVIEGDMGSRESLSELGNEPFSASKGKMLEDKLPVIDKKRKGMNPTNKADWSDYSGI
ncbi:MAG: hypothetical protein JXB48_21215 [Candidatus Latescibacteria bacterium]|nr:hypothetical protein [Candidatus Latescibacterota bacterium]